jgi:hypothetical protein
MPVSSCELVVNTGLALSEKVDLRKDQLYRLIAVGLSSLPLEVETVAESTAGVALHLLDHPLLESAFSKTSDE